VAPNMDWILWYM